MKHIWLHILECYTLPHALWDFSLRKSVALQSVTHIIFPKKYINYTLQWVIINPYLQILENSSKNFSEIFIFWVVTQAVLLENSSSFFSKFQFWGITQTVLLENSSIKNHGHLFSFFKFWGVPQAVLLENSSIRFVWPKPYMICYIWSGWVFQ